MENAYPSPPHLGIQSVAMPAHKNNHGTVFGGYVMGEMDLAGAIIGKNLLNEDQELVTVAVEDLEFVKPLFAGDVFQCWVTVVKIGTTSITTRIQVDAVRKNTKQVDQDVAHGTFIYVCVKEGKPDPITRR